MKKIDITFIVLVLCCLIIPIIRFRPNETVSQVENRNLAAKPSILVEGKINNNFFSDLSSYLQDHFGGRNFLINSSNYIENDIFKRKNINNNKALEGKNGWFFYIKPSDGANFVDFQKKNLLNDEEFENLKTNISETVKWCDENKIKYLFVVCPNKHSVYSEYYPFLRPEGITRADQISQIFSDLNVPYVFSRDYMISKKTEIDLPLYYETDTHWNSLGAYTSFKEILVEIQNQFPNVEFPKIDYEISVSYSETAGDILPMLGINKARCTEISLSPKNGDNSDYYDSIKNEDGIVMKTFGKNQSLPKAVVFHDSFIVSLIQYLSPLFSEAEYNWGQFREEDKEYILQNKPDIIIFESVERYSASIVGK